MFSRTMKSVIPSEIIAKLGTPVSSEVLRQPAEIATHERLGEPHRGLAFERLRRLHPARPRRSVFPALRDEEALLVLAEIDAVEDRGIMGREDHLLLVLLGELDELLDERGDELRVERRIDVIDGKEGRRLVADEEG